MALVKRFAGGKRGFYTDVPLSGPNRFRYVWGRLPWSRWPRGFGLPCGGARRGDRPARTLREGFDRSLTSAEVGAGVDPARDSRTQG